MLETKCSGKFVWEGPDNKCLLYKEGQVWSGDVKTMRGGGFGEGKSEKIGMVTKNRGRGIPVVSL